MANGPRTYAICQPPLPESAPTDDVGRAIARRNWRARWNREADLCLEYEQRRKCCERSAFIEK